MKPAIINVIILYGLMISCYKPYVGNIDTDERILVVDGMITNEKSSYQVRLTYAAPFYSTESGLPVNSAHVFVTDDIGNNYTFSEKSFGCYKSDSTQFTGHPGRIYNLHIETPDGEIYLSDPQSLNPEFSHDSIYAEADDQETINRFNQKVVTIRGANILVNISSPEDTLPRFRFTSNLVKYYFYNLQIPPGDRSPFYSFYCWQTENINSDLNLTHKEYSVNSSTINKHEVYFIDDQVYVIGFIYNLGRLKPDNTYEALVSTERQYYSIVHRVLYLDQYTLNNETYSYYKSMDEQLRSEGKLFDPIAYQLMGNIKCKTNSNKKVFGFFEASAVSRSAYIIGLRKPGNMYSITKVPYLQPLSPDGCWINRVPPFWIN